MSKVDVSIIIVNYYLADFISKNINSLSKEKVSFELIIVDNSQSPSEEHILKEIANNYKNITLILNNKNIGFAAACNKGVKKAKGKYIFFLNPDAYPVDGAITTLFFYAEKLDADAIGPRIFLDKETTIAQPPFYAFTFKNIFLHSFFPKIYSIMWKYMSEKFWNINKVARINFLSGAAFMIKKELAFFDDRFFLYFEDMDLFLRLKKLKKRVFFCPHSKVVHFFDLTPSYKKNTLFQKSQKEFYKKHYPFLQNFIYACYRNRKKYKKKEALKFNDYVKLLKTKKQDSFLCEISLTEDFVPFVKTKISLSNLPSFIERKKDLLWVVACS